MFRRRAAVVPALLVAVAAGSCGGSGERAAPVSHEADRAVAREVARAFLEQREGLATPPTPQEISAAVGRGIDAACRPAAGGRVACRVRVEGYPPYGCTAIVRGSRASDLRCGSAPAPPVVTPGFVDCEDGDGALAGAADAAADASAGADLTRLSVSRSPDVLCVHFELAAAPAGVGLSFIAAKDPPAGPSSESLSVTVRLRPGAPARVRALSRGDISARVGVRGRSVSLVVEAEALPASLRYLFREPFRFRGRARAAGGGPANGDEVPDGPRWAQLP